MVALSVLCIATGARRAVAQVNISIGVGAPVAPAPVVVAPVCPYGYFNYAPYSCSPFGYYGPQWFVGGVFLGAGPWFHGPVGFIGYVNRAYDPRFGYRGPYPHRGERADWGRHAGWERQFHGNEMREEHVHADNGHHYGQYKNHDNNGHEHGHDDDHGNGHDHEHHRD
jgi:hypothetical protein